jgi:hypothetical protein
VAAVKFGSFYSEQRSDTEEGRRRRVSSEVFFLFGLEKFVNSDLFNLSH